MSIRLCLVIPSLDQGGAEKQLCLLAAGLPREMFDVHVVLLTRRGPRQAELDAAGVPTTLIGKRMKADPTAYFRLRATLRRLQPDIVHTWIFAANSYGRAAAASLNVPVIIGSERCVDLWKTSRHFWIDRYLARRSHAITTNSEGVRRFYAEQGIDPELFEVIPNGVEPLAGGPVDRQEAARRLGLDPRRHWIAAVGRLWPQKRYRDLIWAAEMLDTMRGDTTLLIVGEGPQQQELLRHRDAVSDDRRVRFCGHREDVTDWLPHCAAYWIGSGYEGQSNSVLEAMRAGLPVVASDIPGNRDLVVPDQTGFLVPVGDAAAFARETQHLLEHPAERDQLGQAARQRIAEAFTVEQMVARHAALYQRLRSG